MRSTMALFDTAVGTCGLVWSGASVTRFAFPEDDVEALRRRLRTDRPGLHADRGHEMEEIEPDALSGWVRETVLEVQDLLVGRPIDLAWVPVDLSALSAAAQQIYEATRRIPIGQTMTYGEVAAAIGQPGGAQAVGAAMGRNPVPLIVPCHRVVGADGRLVGFSATGGVRLKRRLLDIEGADVVAQRTLF